VFYFLAKWKEYFSPQKIQIMPRAYLSLIAANLSHLKFFTLFFSFVRTFRWLVFSCYESFYIIIHEYWQSLTELPFAPLKVPHRSHIYSVARRIPSSHPSFGVALYARADEAHSG
jgi:hypothetical protein